jgi:signal transduction histidine kinase/ActR/RegA family two-component response regulator
MMPDRFNVNRLFFILILTGILTYGLACRNALAKADWIGVFIYTGVYFWIGASAFFIKTLYRNVTENISRQRALEEKLVQAEKFKSLSLLADSTAHDLNNILSGLATYPEILMMDPDLDPRLRQGLSLIKDSGRKAADVVGDLLTISRGAGADMETLRINAVLERYLCSRDFEKIKDAHKEVDIEFSAEPELLMIQGAYLHIEKIIMNLVLNAVENVSETKGGRVMITTANRFIDPSMPGCEDMIQGEYAVLTVADNGPGMEEEKFRKIFDPFFTTRELGRSGTGLGLTLVRHVIQDHQGFINASSNADGTRFDLFFPALRPDMSQKTTFQKTSKDWPDDIKGNGRMVLVVDGLKEQQRIALGLLEKLGYRAKAVDTGEEAVEAVKKAPVDLVILDTVMTPPLGCLETCRRIQKIRPGQKIIPAGEYPESDDVAPAWNSGTGSFVKKPYTLLDMGIAVKEELESEWKS